MRPIEKLSTETSQHPITVRDQALSQYISHGLKSGILSDTNVFYSESGGYFYCHPSVTFEVHGYRVAVSDGEALAYPSTNGTYYLVLHVSTSNGDASYSFEVKSTIPVSSSIETDDGDAYIAVARFTYSGGVTDVRLSCSKVGITIDDIKDEVSNTNSEMIDNAVSNSVSIASESLKFELTSYCDSELSSKIDSSVQESLNDSVPSIVKDEIDSKTADLSQTASNANTLAKQNASKIPWVRHVFPLDDIIFTIVGSGMDGVSYFQINASDGGANEKLISIYNSYPVCKILLCDGETNFNRNLIRGYTPIFIRQGINDIRIFVSIDVMLSPSIRYIVVYSQDGNPLEQ